jgi:cytochrome c-type protein NapB
MCRKTRTCLTVIISIAAFSGVTCKRNSTTRASPDVTATEDVVRSARRAYHGAPPVIPHQPFGMTCTACHAASATEVPQIGYAPANPHLLTQGLSAYSNCTQCHVFQSTSDTFRRNLFEGLNAPEKGDRAHLLAPPLIPHTLFMRENCLACHSGPAARPNILCSHPERTRCTQCHVERSTQVEYSRTGKAAD